MAHEIKVGDQVQLKSGGPKMTVSDIGAYNDMAAFGVTKIGEQPRALCRWFDKTKLKDGVFELHELALCDSKYK